LVKVELVEESAVRKALSFEIEAETVDREIEAKSREYAKNVKLPGFRPGKIPTHVVKQRFKPQVLEEVAETIINKVVFDELEGRGLRPLSNPQVADLKIDEGQPMTFRAVFETLPVITKLPEYKGLAATTRTPAVADADVDKEVDDLREQQARFEDIEPRPAASRDFAVVDIGWKPQDGGKGGRDQNAILEIGSTDNHQDINDALVGMQPGEEKAITVSYGEDSPVPSLSGKTLDYTLNVKSLKAKVAPAADDAFAKSLGEFETLEALRGAIREGLHKAEERRIDRETKDALVASLVEKADFEVPEALVERHMSARTEDMARGLAMRGVDPSKINFDWRKFRDAQRDESVKAAKADILLHEIAKQEQVEVSDSEVQQELERLAARARRPVETLRAQMEKEGDLESLRGRLREERTLDLIKSAARLETA
jgi:trigger factor